MLNRSYLKFKEDLIGILMTIHPLNVRQFNIYNRVVTKSGWLSIDGGIPIVTPVLLVLKGAMMAPLDRWFFFRIHTTTPAMMATHTIAPTTAPAIVPPLL